VYEITINVMSTYIVSTLVYMVVWYITLLHIHLNTHFKHYILPQSQNLNSILRFFLMYNMMTLDGRV